MNRLLVPLLVLVASMSAVGNAHAASPSSSATSTYLVSFVEPPLAAFRGFEPSADPLRSQLKATSPEATGADRLDVASPDSLAYREWLAQRRAEHLSEISGVLGRPIKAGVALDVVNNLVSLELSQAEAAAVAKLAGVTMVEEEFFLLPQTDAGPAWIGADQIWLGVGGLASRGEGVVVGVIDSGINRTHPSFAAVGPVDGHIHSNPRGRFYGLCESDATACNAKLIGIHDFSFCTGTHNSSDCNDREPNDGLDTDGHGSHVASTAVGNLLNVSLDSGNGSAPRSLSGVAPHANLIAYKACEEEERCRGTWLLAAINQAVADGVAVINYSIGGEATSDPWSSSDSIAMLNAREAGVVVVVAAGNEGPRDGTVTRPGDAPWVLTAANSTHNRTIANRLLDLSGGASPPPSGGVLIGAGATGGYGPASIVIPLDFPGCSTGSAEDFPPTGVSNPWPAGRFNGEIVVCERGVQARVAKSNNVRLAGGGGMVLTNTAVEGESVVADAHSIPSTHLGESSGAQLRAWLSSGSGHRARIEGSQVLLDPAIADILSSSSGRGPVFAGGSMKPSISAPGSLILAAAGTGNGFEFLSGTSMATPHIAGAVALLRALRPNWSVSDIESALMTTAQAVVQSSDGTRIATAFEQGSGRVSIPDALNAGLSFRVTADQFRNARPSLGGDTRTLNQPAIVIDSCSASCFVRRTLTDLAGGGRWRAEMTLPGGAMGFMFGREFDLAVGGSLERSIFIFLDDPSQIGRWVEGQLVFRKISGAAAGDLRIPVRVFSDPGALPDAFNLIMGGDRGAADFSLGGLREMDGLTPFVTAAMVPSEAISTLVEDPTPNDAFDAFGAGSQVWLITIPGSPEPILHRIRVDVESSTSPDVDLFIGEDVDSDGLPSDDEQSCRSASAGSTESCIIDVASQTGDSQVWVLVQNFRAGSTGSDQVRSFESVIPLIDEPSSALTVTAGSMTMAPFYSAEAMLRLEADLPESAPRETHLAYVGLAASPTIEPFVWVPSTIIRNPGNVESERMLISEEPITLRLPPGAASNRLFINVPPNIASMRVATSGSGEVDLFLAHVDSPGSPVVLPAPPRDQADVAAVAPGANNSVLVEAPELTPGRWYITPVNVGTATDAAFSLEVRLNFDGMRSQPRFGAYFDPRRSGSGVFLFAVGDSWGLAWYTYLEDGTPTWYLGVAPRPSETNGLWTVELERFRRNGSGALATKVGEASLSFTGTESFDFSFNLDEYSGSQPMVWIGDTRCPSVGGSQLDINGLWFSPSRPGFGYSVIASPDFENIGAYFYDGNGIARWALGTREPFGADDFIMYERQGACPLCDYLEPTVGPLRGNLTRTYDSASAGTFSNTFPLPALGQLLRGIWQTSPLASTKLSDAVGCE